VPGMLAIAAPFAFFLPLLGHSSASAIMDPETEPRSQDHKLPPVTSINDDATPTALNPLGAWQKGQVARQVRIEQRVIIRISPARRAARQSMLAQLPQQARAQRFEEKRIGGCVEVSGIAGVETDSGNRLLLFLRDRRIVSLNLEKACRARDFYSGFYVERNKDGKVCVDRDKLHSRNGAKCEIDRMRQLVAVTE